MVWTANSIKSKWSRSLKLMLKPAGLKRCWRWGDVFVWYLSFLESLGLLTTIFVIWNYLNFPLHVAIHHKDIITELFIIMYITLKIWNSTVCLKHKHWEEIEVPLSPVVRMIFIVTESNCQIWPQSITLY